MKYLKDQPSINLVVQFYFFKLVETLFHPLKEIPIPDFNYKYDSTML